MPEESSIWNEISRYYSEVVLFRIQNVGITLSHLVVALLSVCIAMVASAVVRSILHKRVLN